MISIALSLGRLLDTCIPSYAYNLPDTEPDPAQRLITAYLLTNITTL
jgi:hypothetical protein